MKLNLHFKSVAMRWFFEVFLIVLLVVTVVAVALSLVLRAVYVERVQALAEEYAFEFKALKSTNADSFFDTAMQITDAFDKKDKIEIQTLDKNGKALISTTGFEPEEDFSGDFKAAVSSKSSVSKRIGKSKTGESVMVQTEIIYGESGEIIGGYRWVVSLDLVYKRIWFTIGAITLVAIVILGICAVSGMFFISSILRPVREISAAARKIAMGDLKIRIFQLFIPEYFI